MTPKRETQIRDLLRNPALYSGLGFYLMMAMVRDVISALDEARHLNKMELKNSDHWCKYAIKLRRRLELYEAVPRELFEMDDTEH